MQYTLEQPTPGRGHARNLLRASEELSADLVRLQVESTVKSYPLTFVVTLVITLTVLVYVGGWGPNLWLLGAALLHIAVCLVVLYRWRRGARTASEFRPSRAIGYAVIEAAVVAGAWILFLSLAAQSASPDQVTLITTVMAGVIAVGALRYAAVPIAGLTFLGVSAGSSAALAVILKDSWMPYEVLIFLGIYVLMLARAVLGYASVVTQQFEAGLAFAQAAGERDLLIAKAQEDEWRTKAAEAAAVLREREKAEGERLRQISQIGRDFEQLIETTVVAVSKTAEQARKSAETMSSSTAAAHRQLSELKRSALTAGRAAATVLTRAEELERALSEVTAKVNEQRSTTKQMSRVATETSDNVRALASVANEIEKMAATIEAVAAKTDLVALNASIEAARAGDAGLGFSVVAGEVKALASQTTEATATVRQLVEKASFALEHTRTLLGAIQEDFSTLEIVAGAVEVAVERQANAVTAVRLYSEDAAEMGSALERTAGIAESSAEQAAQMTAELSASAQTLLNQSRDLASGTAAFMQRIQEA